mgnify:CR=1 FL=1
MTCSPLHRLTDGKCIEYFKSINDVGYNMYLRFIPLNNISLWNTFKFTNYIINTAIKLYFRENLDLFCHIQTYFSVDGLLTNVSMSTESYLQYMDSQLHLAWYITESTDMMVELLINSFHNKYFTLPIENEIIQFKIAVFHNNVEMFDLFNYVSTSNVTTESIDCGAELLERFRFSLDFSISKYTDSTMIPYLPACASFGCYRAYELTTYLDVIPILPCSKLHINSTEYLWDFNPDGSLLLNDTFMIDSSRFYVSGYWYSEIEEVSVCVEDYQRYVISQLDYLARTSSNQGYTVEYIISAVCSALSIIALSLTVFTFWLLPRLRRTLPGKNSLTLAVVMLCAHTLFIVSSSGQLESNTLWCKLVGLLLHLFWLLSICWMNICTFHMFRVLTKSELVAQSSGRKLFLLYHTYASIFSLVCVSVNMVYTFVTFNELGYASVICYISYSEMVLFTFALPTGLIVVTNLGLFTYVIVSIANTPAVQKNVQNERSDLIVFAKLSTITGITWVFGIMNVFLNSSVLDYLFSVLNASQGVFIFLAFVVNRRVSSNFKERMSRLTISSRTDGQTITNSQKSRSDVTSVDKDTIIK